MSEQSWVFTNHRTPTHVDDLNAIEREQLAYAGMLWDGEDKTATERLSDSPDTEGCFLGFVDFWDVVDTQTEEVLYHACLLMVDSGTIFRAGTTEVVAEVIQMYLDHAIDPQLHNALGHAISNTAETKDGHHPRVRWRPR